MALRVRRIMEWMVLPRLSVAVGLVACLAFPAIQGQQRTYFPSFAESSLLRRITAIQELAPSDLAAGIRDLTKSVRELPFSPEKENLSRSLLHIATDRGCPLEAIQVAADALVETVQQARDRGNIPLGPSADLLAQTTKYFGAKVSLDWPAYQAALSKLNTISKTRGETDFTLQDIDGQTWTRSDLKGKVVLVNFWGLTCGPCLHELPDLDEAYQKFRERGFVVLALTSDSAPKVAEYLKHHPMSIPLGLDSGRRIADAYQVIGIPVNLLYDRDGHLVSESLGPWSSDDLASQLANLGLK